ncbi:ATP-binding cassette domain-containing protein [Parablautia intestinalis]|uniref:ATP-binding cassette domain-containing protein n=1 Tax=Parablautia intestinalis TaxID=2320100 RepID=UPI00256ECC03|nr:ABC transporter ATP-binding protein [Parablautia intestinalis]
MLLTIGQLEVKYGSQTALKIEDPISFKKGERIGIIGSNGAGKSTLIKAVLGLVPYRGRIITQLKPEQMAVHMQFNGYVTTMPVRYIMETILGTKIAKNKELQELISFFDFESCLPKRFNALSGGQKQKFTIILVMFQKAGLTFYDEVTSGLDFETRQKLTEMLSQWYRDKDDTLVVISHYYEELEQLADKLLILDKGRVVDFGRKNELFERYCGRVVIIMENSGKNKELSKGFPVLKSPEHLLAISCKSKEQEREMMMILTENNVNFKRSNSDIEMMFMNARERFYAQ